jgi:Methyltransferase domain
MAGQASFRQGPFTDTGLPGRSAQAVMSIDALLFAPSKPAAAAELARILTPGGRLVLTSWDCHSQPAGRPFQITDHRPLLDRAGAAAPDARHLHPHRRGAAPVMSWARRSCSGTSSRAGTGPGSWNSAATCAPSTCPRCASRSSATTTAST